MAGGNKKKKNKKKTKKTTEPAAVVEEVETPEVLAEGTEGAAADAADTLSADDAALLAALDPSSRGKSKEQLLKDAFMNMQLGDDHKFWSTQPVPQHGQRQVGTDCEDGEIETRTVDEVQKEPYNLPVNYMWADCNINDPGMVDEIYELLRDNYVEDDENMFRFDYCREFLMWALTPPGYQKHLHVCVRVATGKQKLVGFITGIPADVSVHGKVVKMVEINFLCVHKRLRSKRLAPVLIKEITRRVNLGNVWQAVYTAGKVLPKPVGRNRYYHRSLNPKKLIDIGFSRLAPRRTLSMTVKLYRVPTTTQTPGIRPLEERDVPAATALLANYLKRFALHQKFDEHEFKHWFLTRPNVVYSYVVEDPETKQITDFLSFYSLPSSIIGHERYNLLKACYSFYNVSTKTKWHDLMYDALILAKQLDFDVFNALDVMHNKVFLHDLKFGLGDGHLQYYLYNWQCKEMLPQDCGLVLL